MAPAGVFRASSDAERIGLSAQVLEASVRYVYETLDAIDAALLARGSTRLAAIVELANLSSMIGNLLRTGVAQASKGVLRSNGPHKHPDLLHVDVPENNVEIKVALGGNQPKGHLAKPGWHLTCHYVLCDESGAYRADADVRGAVPRVWMLRFGFLRPEHFNLSNTAGDSGKTAVVNAVGMSQLAPVYLDPDRCALSRSSRAKRTRVLFEAMGLDYLTTE